MIKQRNVSRKKEGISRQAIEHTKLRTAKIKKNPIFSVANHPPSVEAGARKYSNAIANDAVSGINSWANAGAEQFVNDAFEEGVTFLGYPYLAELSQRSEYRIIVETIATEMTRAGIKIGSSADQSKAGDKEKKIKDLTKAIKDFKLMKVICDVLIADGFFGRGHLYINLKSEEDLIYDIGNGRDELSKAKVKKGGLKEFRSIEPIWCYPLDYETQDPLKDNWYRPDTWYVLATPVHRTRLIPVISRPVSDILKPTYSFGGLSLSQMAKPYVDNWLKTRQSVNDILQSFVTWILSTDLSTQMQGDGEQLANRVEFFNLYKSNRGLMVLDKESEEFNNVSAPLTGLDKLQAQAQEHMASVSHIPLVKLTGIAPSGLNASSEGEIRVFYDFIHSMQNYVLRDVIETCVSFIQLHLWGAVDEDLHVEFVQLWGLTENEDAAVRKSESERITFLAESGIISVQEARQQLASDPNSGFSSLDVDDIPEMFDEESEENFEGDPNESGSGNGVKKVPSKDAPRDEKSLYTRTKRGL